ncbi:MAG: phosphoenolpyruvate synthase [Pseudomonadales bacterium]|nr:phosphoenolpyruvate synthase [Pseudomonadales bacterium]
MLVFKSSVDNFAKKEAGGKGYNLYLMAQNGVPVPEWVVIGRTCYESFVEESGIGSQIAELLESFTTGKSSAQQASKRIAELITSQPLPDSIAQLVAQAYASIGTDNMISVRSSAADEDSAAHSFAGQLSSFLYVQGVEDAGRYLLECWASGFTDRSLIYRSENNIPLEGVAVAVVFQRMIDPDTSGVLFTCDPLEENTDSYLVSSVYGVGEGLVSGALDSDTYWLNASNGKLNKQEIAEKTEAFRRTSSGECQAEKVDPEKVNIPSLTEKQLSKLFRLGEKIFQQYRTPQDIEWAYEGDDLYVLQTRPVTTLSKSLTGYLNLWDNSNIVESYGGVTSPLSFTFALENYKNVYIQFCEILTVPRPVVKEMEYYLGNMLGSINGRVFYNLYNWYKLVGVLPGFSQNKQFMETMMGVGEELSPEVAERIKPHDSWDTPIGKFRKFKTGLKFLYYHFAIQDIVDQFLRDFQREYKYFRSKNYSRMSSDEIFNEYLAMNRAMLDKWKAPIINDFLCMVHFGVLKKLTGKWLSRLDENIQNDLLAGEGNLESALPTKTLIQFAGEVAKNEGLKALVENTPDAQLLEALKQSEYQGFYHKVCDYIDRFGFRCMSEMKLEEKDLFSDPSFLFVCLKNYVRSGTTDLQAYELREKELRTNAEALVAKELTGLKKNVYFWSLKHARKAVKNRENTRFARTRAYGVARSMFQSMGLRLTELGVLKQPDDVFYLTLDEIYGIHQGTLTAYSLGAFVELRKQEYAEFEDQEPKIRFQTRGPVYWKNDFIDVPETPDVEEGADYHLKGLACCPGVVEGIVRVVHSPNEDLTLDGQILVAKRTDPGWVPLFPSVAALLVERGSLLSHSAIVAREMGIPAVVGVKGLLNTLETGMRVRMDGQKGTITILEQ